MGCSCKDSSDGWGELPRVTARAPPKTGQLFGGAPTGAAKPRAGPHCSSLLIISTCPGSPKPIFPYPRKNLSSASARSLLADWHAGFHDALLSRRSSQPVMASDLSAAATLASSLTGDMPVMSTSAVEMASKPSSGWFGILGWVILSLINLVSMALYWSIRIITITIPSLLYALLSASWTVTMNATTLYVFNSSWLPSQF